MSVCLANCRADRQHKGISSKGYTPLHAAGVGGSIACCRQLQQAGANVEARSNAGLSVWDTAASDEVRAVFVEPVMLVAAHGPHLEPKLLSRRHSIAYGDDDSGTGVVMQSWSTGVTSGSGSGPSSKGSSRRVRVPRERSISTPFLVTPRNSQPNEGGHNSKE